MAQATYPFPARVTHNGNLFGLAPSGVYRAVVCYQQRGALLPHPFTLTKRTWRSTLCCTSRQRLRTAQALPGTLPCGARTFLPLTDVRQRLSGQRVYFTGFDAQSLKVYATIDRIIQVTLRCDTRFARHHSR